MRSKVKRAFEVVATGPERVLVRDENGFRILEADSDTVLTLARAIAGGTTGELPIAQQKAAQAVESALGPSLSAESTSPTTGGGIGLITCGPLGALLRERLEGIGLGLTRLELTRGSPSTESRFPSREVAALEWTEDALAPLRAPHALVVCALENATWAEHDRLQRVFAAGETPSWLLFVLLDRGMVTIGPLGDSHHPPCFVCDRLDDLGLDAEDEAARAALDAFSSADIGALAPLAQEQLLATLTTEILHIARTGRPIVPGTVIEITDDGAVRRRRGRAIPNCPSCAAARPFEDAARSWRSAAFEPTPTSSNDETPLDRTIDERAARGIVELDARGATSMGHAVSSFHDHLIGTWNILRAWGVSSATALTGLAHSAYGSDYFDQPLFGLSERARVVELFGTEVERRVFLFCTIDRKRLWTDLQARDRIDRSVEVTNWHTKQHGALSPDDLRWFLEVECANFAEQVHAGDLSPGIFIARCAHFGALLASMGAEPPAPFVRSTELEITDEERARSLYMEAWTKLETPAEAESLLRESARLNPFVGEPLIVAADVLAKRADPESSSLARQGIERMARWATAWDKRRSFEAWLGHAAQLSQGATESRRG